ncbi:hypothetical protein [Lentzea aerocolonigenes]|uniref:hypothetical protein n=1 Tax=Lentzea aerocolonigenes TaxID=68170 RepID=UPI000A80A3F5|nr:hypothetical protein [Lentzea aerocolonigenes]
MPMRHAGKLLAALGVVVLVVVKRRSSKRPPSKRPSNRPLTAHPTPPATPVPPETAAPDSTRHRPARRQTPLTRLVAMVLLLLVVAGAVGWFAWVRYETAVSQPPETDAERNTIKVHIVHPENNREKAAKLSVTLEPNHPGDPKGPLLLTTRFSEGSRQANGCVAYVVEIRGRPKPPRQSIPPIEPDWFHGDYAETAGYFACQRSDPDDGSRVGKVLLAWSPDAHVIEQRGSWTAVTGPVITADYVVSSVEDHRVIAKAIARTGSVGETGQVYGTPAGLEAECVSDFSKLKRPDMRLEIATPEAADSELRWKVCGVSVSALLVSVPGKAAADRALFEAGLIGGGAVSFFLIALQLVIQRFLEARPERGPLTAPS